MGRLRIKKRNGTPRLNRATTPELRQLNDAIIDQFEERGLGFLASIVSDRDAAGRTRPQALGIYVHPTTADGEAGHAACLVMAFDKRADFNRFFEDPGRATGLICQINPRTRKTRPRSITLMPIVLEEQDGAAFPSVLAAATDEHAKAALSAACCETFFQAFDSGRPVFSTGSILN